MLGIVDILTIKVFLKSGALHVSVSNIWAFAVGGDLGFEGEPEV